MGDWDGLEGPHPGWPEEMDDDKAMQPTPSMSTYQATQISRELRAVIAAQKLYTVIQGKAFVHCEGWTLLASLVGARPYVCWSKPVTDSDGKKGWEARVEVMGKPGMIGSGESMCTRSEKTWENRPDFALRAMAQTRATSRALRNPLGFIMKLAGYEATPEEEMR